ncbi:MAG: Sigma-W factor [Planctomycetota bacterium]|jgi:RNA polymerase sigma-70 factor (ECF subfamily)
MRVTDPAEPDAELLDRLARGDALALAPVFEHHRARLRRMIEVRLDPRLAGRLDPDDVLQEVYLAAAQRMGTWSPERGSVLLWLRMIAQQVLVDLFRHHVGAARRAAGREAAPAASGAWSSMFVASMTSPSQVAARADMVQKVEAALEQMDPIDREVLVLRHFEELGNKEAAEVLGIQENAASNRYVRALTRLRGLLGEVS